MGKISRPEIITNEHHIEDLSSVKDSLNNW